MQFVSRSGIPVVGRGLRNVAARGVSGARRFASGAGGATLWQGIRSSPNTGAKIAGMAGALGVGGLCAWGMSQPTSFENSGTRAIVSQYGYTSGMIQTRLMKTYGYVTAGLALTATAATVMFQKGLALRLMNMNPWMLAGGSIVGLMVTGGAARMIHPDNVIPKHLAFGAFTSMIALSLCPLGAMVGVQVLKQAAMATGLVVGSLSTVAMCAKNDAFLSMGPALGVGFGCVMAASLGSIVFPGSALLHNVVMYGGLGLFGLFLCYDTQKMLHNAEMKPEYDAMAESMGIYIDTIQIFWRLALIFGGNRRK